MWWRLSVHSMPKPEPRALGLAASRALSEVKEEKKKVNSFLTHETVTVSSPFFKIHIFL